MVESSSQYTNFPNHGATFLLPFFVTWQSTDINPIMENLNFSGNFASSGSRVNVNIGVFEFKEDDNTIVYSPAFDLSGYGKDLVEAKSSFEIAMEEFFKTRKDALLIQIGNEKAIDKTVEEIKTSLSDFKSSWK